MHVTNNQENMILPKFIYNKTLQNLFDYTFLHLAHLNTKQMYTFNKFNLPVLCNTIYDTQVL